MQTIVLVMRRKPIAQSLVGRLQDNPDAQIIHASKCMLLLMCPEQDENSITRVVEAKRKKRIDDFVFYDVTIEYLISKLISMYPSNGKYEMLRGEHKYGSN